MKINQRKQSELEAHYEEICKRHYSTRISELPKLKIKVIDGEGKIEAKNNLIRLIDYTISKDGKLSLKFCDPYFHEFITDKSQPFDIVLLG
mgnify:CR=1 FL=1